MASSAFSFAFGYYSDTNNTNTNNTSNNAPQNNSTRESSYRDGDDNDDDDFADFQSHDDDDDDATDDFGDFLSATSSMDFAIEKKVSPHKSTAGEASPSPLLPKTTTEDQGVDLLGGGLPPAKAAPAVADDRFDAFASLTPPTAANDDLLLLATDNDIESSPSLLSPNE